MLTRLTIRKFKRIDEADFELGQNVVFIGPNNSGKTSALQAIALWECGLRAYLERRGNDDRELKRTGVPINRNDLIALSVPRADFLWKDIELRVTKRNEGGDRHVENISIEVIAEGIDDGERWRCGFEFDYANTESFYCRLARKVPGSEERIPLPSPRITSRIKVAFLPPMSGLASIEPKLELGRINVLIGEGQTAQILRNLCFRVYEDRRDSWTLICGRIRELFGVELLPPEYVSTRGEVTMRYGERGKFELDLSSSGRGLQQTLLLLVYIASNPGTIILLDEPDAHLEVLRQRQNYHLIAETAADNGCQLIAASHSATLMNEAAERDTVIAFIGKPHALNDRGSQVLKALNDIGFDQYYQAEQRGWVLYLEGSTDLSILRTIARRVGHPAAAELESPFVHYLSSNVPKAAEEHFWALREACPTLRGLAIFDRIEAQKLKDGDTLRMRMWRRREIENYICTRELLLKWAAGKEVGDLFALAERHENVGAMEACILELEHALEVQGRPSPWSADIKVTDDFLDPLFRNYLKHLGYPPNAMGKKAYYELAELIPIEEIDDEVLEALDAIVDVSHKAAIDGRRPSGGDDV